VRRASFSPAQARGLVISLIRASLWGPSTPWEIAFWIGLFGVAAFIDNRLYGVGRGRSETS